MVLDPEISHHIGVRSLVPIVVCGIVATIRSTMIGSQRND